jgi:hypothetical protein
MSPAPTFPSLVSLPSIRRVARSGSSTGADSRSASAAETRGPSWYAWLAVAVCAPMQNAFSFTVDT